jgi:hypothetical protein
LPWRRFERREPLPERIRILIVRREGLIALLGGVRGDTVGGLRMGRDGLFCVAAAEGGAGHITRSGIGRAPLLTRFLKGFLKFFHVLYLL